MLERRGGAVAVLDNQKKLSDLIDLMVDGYVGNEIASALVKAAIVDADALGVIDSDDNWEFKRTTLAALWDWIAAKDAFLLNSASDKMDGTLSLKERATAEASVVSYGQFWSKDQTPNIPMFTDDEGNDTQLGVTAASIGQNMIINGDVKIWQRGTSFSSTVSTVTYFVDGFYYRQSGGSAGDITFSRQTIQEEYVARVTINNPVGCRIAQIIETVNVMALQGETVTLSIDVRTPTIWLNAAGTILKLVSGTGDDQGSVALESGQWTNAASTNGNFTGLNTAFQTFQITTTLGANVSELAFKIEWGAGDVNAGDILEFRNVRIAKEATASPFVHKPVSEELANCQRYYQIGCKGNAIHMYSATAGDISVTFPVEMRVAPTVSFAPGMTITTATINGGGKSSSTAVSSPALTTRGGFLRIASGFVGATDEASGPITNNSLCFDAEL